MGYCRSRRLRSSAPPILSWYWCHLDVFQHWFSRFSRKYPGEVDARGFFYNWLITIFFQVRHFCPNVPIILVGNKKDLRSDPQTIRELGKMKQVGYLFTSSLYCLQERVRPEQGKAIAEQIGAFAYLECSAKTKDVSQFFQFGRVHLISAVSTECF